MTSRFRIEYIKGNLNRVADELSRRADYEAEANAERATENAANRNDEPPRVKLIDSQVTNTNTTATTNTTTTTTATTNDDTKEDEVKALWRISMDGFPLLDDLKEAAKRDEVYQQEIAKPHPRNDGLTVGEGLLWTCEGLLYIPADPALRQLLIRQVHDCPHRRAYGVSQDDRPTHLHLLVVWYEGNDCRLCAWVSDLCSDETVSAEACRTTTTSPYPR